MFLRGKIRNVFSMVIISFILESAIAFSEEELFVPKQAIDLKTIKEKEEKGLNLAKKAIIMADPYPSIKKDVMRKNDELQVLKKRRNDLTIFIQKAQVMLNRKKAEHANNPPLLKMAVKQYTQKIEELRDELSEVDRQIPTLESKLAKASLELQVEELVRGDLVDDEDTDAIDEEFEGEILERFNTGKGLLDLSSLSERRFR
jgi:seryl-tRNA synthetase